MTSCNMYIDMKTTTLTSWDESLITNKVVMVTIYINRVENCELIKQRY